MKDDGSYLAYAGPCAFDETTKRPNVGRVAMNLKNLGFGKRVVRNLRAIVLHEIMHIMIMSPSLF